MSFDYRPMFRRGFEAGNGTREGRELPRLFNLDRITSTDRASALDCRVDTHADLVVLRGRAQDARIRWQVPLGQSLHDKAATRPRDPHSIPTPHRQRAANPPLH